MGFWGGFAMFDREDFPEGMEVITPSGRRAIVVKQLSGASKFDPFSRVTCRYVGGGPKDLVTLQPHQLKKAGKQQEQKPASPAQLNLFFA
jgi:hypothetical protein